MVGQTLGHYKILELLGKGGMGVVYRAEDTTLKRQVALKVLPASSQERLERFQREAETLAALDHPNIVTVFTVELDEDVHFLTMQLVEGMPLSDLIPKGGMPLERIFETAIPLADALAAAHDKGVIHRDLKPANIMVTDEGRVKVLDFGLAKLRQEAQAPIATQLPTEPLTEEGRAVGTVPYMSPEQVEGKEVDHRSDLFSLGIILFEMATGQRPFHGDSPASVMSAILRDTPPSVTELSTSLPRDLAKIIRRCLVKEPERRFQTARELAIELEELQSEVASGEAWQSVSSSPSRHPALLLGGIAAAGIVLAAVMALIVWVVRFDAERATDESEPRAVAFTRLLFDTARKGAFSASPNGDFFVYASDALGNWDIYLQRIGGGKAINLTEDSPVDDKQPSFSPDGEAIAFRSERDAGGIYIMGATGESVRRVTDRGYLPNWSPDGTRLVYSTSGQVGRWLDNIASRIWIVDLSNGKSHMVLDRSALGPDWSPNGWRIAYQGFWEPSEGVQQRDLFTVPAEGGEPVPVTEDGHYADTHAWSANGQSLYYASDRSGTKDLWRLPIEERTGQVLGRPVAMTSGSNVGRHISPVGDGNRILYSTDLLTSQIFKVPFDPLAGEVSGPPTSITSPSLQAWLPSVSPDGEWVAFDADFGKSEKRAIGVVRADGTDIRRITDGKYRDRYPRWSPNGRQIAFWGNRSGNAQAWIMNVDGSGLRQMTDAPDVTVGIPVWSPDGKQLTLCSPGGTTYVFQADKSWSEESPAVLPPFDGTDGAFCPLSWSPDGSLLAGAHMKEAFDERPAMYSFERETYQTIAEDLTAKGLWSVWLNDSRRVLINAQQDDSSTIFLLDTGNGEYEGVFSSADLSKASGPITGQPSLSADNQTIYVSRLQRRNEIWMLTLKEEE
jgi:Tol biopolymer transport system component/predicted Ser/Thr protein kinase